MGRWKRVRKRAEPIVKLTVTLISATWAAVHLIEFFNQIQLLGRKPSSAHHVRGFKMPKLASAFGPR
jgi:hypothetical protein